MKRQKILEKNIEELDINPSIVNVLKENSINKIEDVWALSRKDLKDFNLKDSDISQITIKLQLYGLDLNKKVY